MNRDFIFVEKYAPQKVEQCILPESIKSFFLDVRNSGKVPNMILSGPPGIGKTSTIKALAEELDRDFMVINGSDERSIDIIRNKVKNYASTLSLSNTGKKILLIDEADNLTNDAQLALRASIEELQSNCTFIFTCNYKNKLIPPLHSRVAVIDFSIPSGENISPTFLPQTPRYSLSKERALLASSMYAFVKIELLVCLSLLSPAST